MGSNNLTEVSRDHTTIPDSEPKNNFQNDISKSPAQTKKSRAWS